MRKLLFLFALLLTSVGAWANLIKNYSGNTEWVKNGFTAPAGVTQIATSGWTIGKLEYYVDVTAETVTVLFDWNNSAYCGLITLGVELVDPSTYEVVRSHYLRGKDSATNGAAYSMTDVPLGTYVLRLYAEENGDNEAFSKTGGSVIITGAELPTINFTLTDADGKEYTGSYKAESGLVEPNFTGIANMTLSNKEWSGTHFRADVTFPLPLSKEVFISTFRGSKDPGTMKYYVDGENVKVNPSTAVSDNNDKWIIEPTLNGTSFTFKIKSVGKSKYITTTADATTTGAVTTVTASGTDFTIDADNRFKLPTTTSNGTALYLSAGSSNGANQNLGAWTWNGNNGVHNGNCNFIYEANIECLLTDSDGNVYEVEADASGSYPWFGIPSALLSNVIFNDQGLSATINFPFPVSNASKINPTLIVSGASWGSPNIRKWRAVQEGEDYYVKMLTSAVDYTANDALWAIFPQFSDGKFSFAIKNIGVNKFIKAKNDATGDNNNDNVGGQAKPVSLVDADGTSFAFEQRTGNNYQFVYNNTADTKLSLSISGSSTTHSQYLGVYKNPHSGNDVGFPDYCDNMNYPIPVSKNDGTADVLTLMTPFTASNSLKYYVDEESNVMVSNTLTAETADNYLWVIYPIANANGISFAVKHHNTGKFIKTTKTQSSSATNDKGAVVVVNGLENATHFTLESNNCFKIPDLDLRMSVTSSGTSPQYVTVHSGVGHNGVQNHFTNISQTITDFKTKVGYVGWYPYSLLNEIESVSSYSEYLEFVENHAEDIVSLKDGGYYYIKGSGLNGSTTNYAVNEDGNFRAKTAENATLTAGNIWRFVGVEDGYKIQSYTNGQYVLLTSATNSGYESPIDKSFAQGYKFLFTDNGAGKFTVKDENNKPLRHEGSDKNYAINSWNNQVSTWYIVEAPELPLTMHQTGLSTFSASVDLEIPDGVTVYYARRNDGETIRMAPLSGVIPAKTGVVVEAEGNTPVNFPVIANADALPAENLLKAHLNTEAVTAETGYSVFIMATRDGETGFYPLSTTNNIIGGHKSYLEIRATNTARLSIVWDDTETGIFETEAGEQNAEIYDLTGRRLDKPTKGVNVVGGKLVIK